MFKSDQKYCFDNITAMRESLEKDVCSLNDQITKSAARKYQIQQYVPFAICSNGGNLVINDCKSGSLMDTDCVMEFISDFNESMIKEAKGSIHVYVKLDQMDYDISSFDQEQQKMKARRSVKDIGVDAKIIEYCCDI